MSDRIKVAGYSQKVTYTDGIEYRNFSPDLVGLQLASDGGTPLFTMGNFSITTNFDPKKNKNFTTTNFSNFITLSDLDLTLESSLSLLTTNAGVILNLDKRNLTNYALFNSLKEFVRVSLENIITNWPAALYVTPIFDSEDFDTTQSGLTVQNYYYDSITDKAYFYVATEVLNNPYQINYSQNGTLKDTFNQENDIRNLALNYESYTILYNSKEADVLEFTASTTSDNYLYFVVKGDIFTGITGDAYLTYHIKPNKTNENLFFNGLPKFESYLLNRLTNPKYTALFNYTIKSDTGDLLYVSKNVTWPVSDGYNLDFDTDAYSEYASSLVEISEGFDAATSNLMVRFLVTDSISDFDTTEVHLDPLDEDTSGQKMNKTLTIYGVEFDKINNFINGIKFANTVSYDKNNNTPDIYLKNLARVLGWDLISSVLENNLLKSYIEPKESTYSGQSVGLTLIEADVELWRRIILNTPWIWKSKGTRKAIEFLFKFIGTPLGLISFNEYVYLAEDKIDVDIFREALRLNGYLDDISQFPISVSGYPNPLPNTADIYFQGNGLWYRETGGDNASLDITSGNNPHVGPYDGGYKYINQFKELIPNFSAVTISSQTVTTSTKNLFTNYNLGKITAYSGNTYVDVTNDDGMDFSNCFVVDTTIIQDPKGRKDETACGCQTPEELQSLSICIDKSTIESPSSTCQDEIAGYTLVAPENYYVFNFNQYNIDGSLYTVNGSPIYYQSKFVNKECCNINGSKAYFYNEYSISFNDYTQQELFNSGYICCKSDNSCGCLVTCKWNYANETHTSASEMYLVFNNELNQKVVVSEDGCNCVQGYTIPVSITDPFTGKVGYGCQLTQLGKTDLNKSDSIIKKTYTERSNGSIGCSQVSVDTTIKKVFGVVLNDVDDVGKITTSLSYSVIGPILKSYSFLNTNTSLSGASVGYLAAVTDTQAMSDDGNIMRMVVQGQIALPSNLPFDPQTNKMYYLNSDVELSSIDFANQLANLVEVTPISTSRGGQYYADFTYNSLGSETYTYLVWDYRSAPTQGAKNLYKISYTNNISSQPIQLLIGNNSSSPSNKIYDGLYSSDPIVGTSSQLPAVNASVVLAANGANIIMATCNGVTISPNSPFASWQNVNDNIDISFTTNTPIVQTNGRRITVKLANSLSFICDAPDTEVWVSEADANMIITSGDLKVGMKLYTDSALTTYVKHYTFVKYKTSVFFLDSQFFNIVAAKTNKTC